MNRLQQLRQAALEPAICFDEFYYHFHKSFAEQTEIRLPLRYAHAFGVAMDSITPAIDHGELIVGKISCHLSASQRQEWETVYSKKAEEITRYNLVGQDSHMAIDYPLLLDCGINGILDRINGYLQCGDEEKRDFYEACRLCLQAVVRHAEKYADTADALATAEADPARREELRRIAAVCRRVPAQPAQSFYEAVQAAHFVTYCLTFAPFRMVWQQFQLGHPDRYLLPYYEADIHSGTLTKEEARLLLDCLGIQINTRVPNGLSCGYMVGGRNEQGEIVANDLTLLCMQVVDDIRLVYPAVGLCWTEGMPDLYLEKACEILSRGCSHPAIFNDDIITKGLISYGVPEAEARSYIHSTCVEITPVASSNVWVASPYTNMAQLLLDVLDREYHDFDSLLEVVLHRLDGIIEANFEEQNAMRSMRAAHGVNPLLSCFVKDCLAQGLDIEQGGARYNWIMPSFVGMANLVDSLYAIKTLVFDSRELTIAELKDILDSNFEGHEALRLRLLNSIPKYGNDIDEVDGYFTMLIDHLVTECKKYTGMFKNGNLIPSVFCWIIHERFGRETGATPDGRPACFPLGDGSGPCQGREMNGPTASILSSTKWPHHQLIGGVAVNMKFSKKTFTANSFATMVNLIKTYLKRGGFEMQINVVDRETLLNARQRPEAYKDLVVRIGGYSDYFVRLSPHMQEEVILRTEHGI